MKSNSLAFFACFEMALNFKSDRLLLLLMLLRLIIISEAQKSVKSWFMFFVKSLKLYCILDSIFACTDVCVCACKTALTFVLVVEQKNLKIKNQLVTFCLMTIET